MDGDGKRMKNVFAEIYIWAIVTLGFGCLVAGSLSVKVATLDPLMFVLLLGLAAAAQRNPVMLFRSSAISMSFAITVAAYVLFGVGVALWVNVAALALAYEALGVFGAAVFVLPLGVAWYSFKLYVLRTNETRAENAKLNELNRLFEQSNAHLAEAHISIVGALLGSLEAKSTTGTAHLAATIYRSVAVAKRLGLDHLSVEAVQLGALFHDLGKIAISDAILQKPDRLSDEEWSEIRAHPIIGASLLAQMPELDHIRPLILAHHERFDGRGYPNGLKEDAIPRAAMIVAVADAYEAMTTPRPYRRAITPEAA